MFSAAVPLTQWVQHFLLIARVLVNADEKKRLVTERLGHNSQKRPSSRLRRLINHTTHARNSNSKNVNTDDIFSIDGGDEITKSSKLLALFAQLVQMKDIMHQYAAKDNTIAARLQSILSSPEATKMNESPNFLSTTRFRSLMIEEDLPPSTIHTSEKQSSKIVEEEEILFWNDRNPLQSPDQFRHSSLNVNSPVSVKEFSEEEVKEMLEAESVWDALCQKQKQLGERIIYTDLFEMSILRQPHASMHL